MLRTIGTVALCALLAAKASAESARYVRIYHITDQPNSIINLDEVEAYDCMGEYIQAASATMASPLGNWPASNCINRQSAGTGCHSTNNSNSWLEIDFGRPVAISSVIVRNRVDCCQERIIGYSIALFNEPNGVGMQSYPQLFAELQQVYNFSFPDGGCPSVKEVRTMSDLGMSRYVMIWREAVGIINLDEIAAYDCNGLYIEPESLSMSSVHPAGPNANCINNRTGGFCHTLPEPNASLVVDFGRHATVSYVTVTNRLDCCQNRIEGYNIGLFAGPGYAPIGVPRQFVGVSRQYTFNFGPCSSVQSLANTVALVSTQLGMARYIRIWNDGTSILNLNEVTAFDCDGNQIQSSFAALSTTHGAGPAFNCINGVTNVSNDFCHTSNATHNWLEIDLGFAQPVGTVVVRNRIDCCSDRIIGFNIGLFNGPLGTLPVGSSTNFAANMAVYNFTQLRTCSSVPAISAAVSTMSALTVQLQPLSNSVSSQSTILANAVASVGAVSTVAAAASSGLGSLSTSAATVSTTLASVSQQVANAATSVAAVSSSVASLQAAIRNAVNAAPSGGQATPAIGTTAQGTINVASGSCSNSDLCDATSFAASLKQALASV